MKTRKHVAACPDLIVTNGETGHGIPGLRAVLAALAHILTATAGTGSNG